MNTNKLKKFAQITRKKLIEQIGARLEHVLVGDSAELRAKSNQVKEVHEEVKKSSKKELVERVAYIWFNRFIALRFMDANDYNTIHVITPVPGHTLPEVLEEAKKGNIDSELGVNRTLINDLLNGRITSQDPQNEVYKLLLVAILNSHNSIMPFMFEYIDDYTELLMPDDLLSDMSVVVDIKNGMEKDECKDVEIIGWLYQFYISEEKDRIIGAKKRYNENEIAPATQLFTPKWIVKYMVDNTLGQLWIEAHPKSKIKEHLEFYIEPKDRDKIPKREIKNPLEIKIFDPACGSGHILVYAFDVLYKIYEEEGYDTSEIPSLIFNNNLHGVDIDERAAQLASFCLMMKAMSYNRRFFKKGILPNVMAFKNIENDPKFENAKIFGSLIKVTREDVDAIKVNKRTLVERDQLVHKRQAELLANKYDCVITNPPYMGAKNYPIELANYIEQEFIDSKGDLFATFIEVCQNLTLKNGFTAMITQHAWMFLSTYEKLRKKIVNINTIRSMIHLGSRAFKEIGGEVVQTTSFILQNNCIAKYKPTFVRLVDIHNAIEKENAFLRGENRYSNVMQSDFTKIPGSPIAYWVSDRVREIFEKSQKLGDVAEPRQGLATADNDRFLRLWQEVDNKNIGFGFKDRKEAKESGLKWFPYNKGGEFRKWYGNNDWVINWKNDGEEIFNFRPKSVIRNPSYYFREGITWSSLSSSNFGARYSKCGSIFDTKGPILFNKNKNEIQYTLGLLTSKLVFNFLKILAPTLDFNQGPLGKLPINYSSDAFAVDTIFKQVNINCNISTSDWDSRETSWDFKISPLLTPAIPVKTGNQNVNSNDFLLETAYNNYCTYWHHQFFELHKNEEELNRIFIEIYGLADEMTPDVALKDITILQRETFINDKNELAFKKDEIIKQFISYAVGCMFGRYSLDKEGLILANQGETVEDYLKQIPNPTILPDVDNIIPILEEEYFTDDIVGKFKEFIKISFGKEHYEENLRFVEDAIGKDIRKYFIKDFYADHIQRYKKRPIYWLFSSPKKSFNVLIYMHRYRQDTISRILNEYLREFKEKLNSKKEAFSRILISEGVKPSDKAKATKEISKIEKILHELEDYERNILYPLAAQKIEIDLDDGVAVNYIKFGRALQKITGLTEEKNE